MWAIQRVIVCARHGEGRRAHTHIVVCKDFVGLRQFLLYLLVSDLARPTYPPPPFAHARPCPSTGWALNRRSEETLGPLFLWSRMEDWAFVERLGRERGAQSYL